MNSNARRQVVDPTPNNAGGPDWEIAGAGDFNADGKVDLLWQHRVTSQLLVWYMDGTARLGLDTPFPDRPANDVQNWKIQGLGDFDGDGKVDLLWQHQIDGWLVVWLMDGVRQRSATAPNPNRPASDFANWKVATVAPAAARGERTAPTGRWFWQHQGGGWLVAWLMSGLTRQSTPPVVPNAQEGDAANWKVAASADMNADGQVDLVFRNRVTGANLVWTMDGATRLGTLPLDFY
jgi:hypothetical protein